MPQEPSNKRTIAFFDGQNLFHAVKQAFGYTYPNYDPLALAQIICRSKNWDLVQTYFYTGLPSLKDDPFWHYFWTANLAVMGTRGIQIYSRRLQYTNKTINLDDGTTTTVRVGREKGIDVRIALDVVRMARENSYDVALIFSQDQDLSEVADEV